MLTLFLSRLAEKKSIIDYLLLDPAEKLRTNIMHTPSSYKSSVIRAPVPWKQSRVVAQQYCRQSSYKKVTGSVIQYIYRKVVNTSMSHLVAPSKIYMGHLMPFYCDFLENYIFAIVARSVHYK